MFKKDLLATCKYFHPRKKGVYRIVDTRLFAVIAHPIAYGLLRQFKSTHTVQYGYQLLTHVLNGSCSLFRVRS